MTLGNGDGNIPCSLSLYVCIRLRERMVHRWVLESALIYGGSWVYHCCWTCLIPLIQEPITLSHPREGIETCPHPRCTRTRYISRDIYAHARTAHILGNPPLPHTRDTPRCHHTQVMICEYPDRYRTHHPAISHLSSMGLDTAHPSWIPAYGILLCRLLSTDSVVLILSHRTRYRIHSLSMESPLISRLAYISYISPHISRSARSRSLYPPCTDTLCYDVGVDWVENLMEILEDEELVGK